MFTLGRGEVREKVEGQQFTRGVENTNMTSHQWRRHLGFCFCIVPSSMFPTQLEKFSPNTCPHFFFPLPVPLSQLSFLIPVPTLYTCPHCLSVSQLPLPYLCSIFILSDLSSLYLSHIPAPSTWQKDWPDVFACRRLAVSPATMPTIKTYKYLLESFDLYG